jgi:ankyrin repeat protein
VSQQYRFCLLHLAINRRAKQEVIETLLAAGANIEASCKSSIYEGYRPLHFAAHEKNASTVRLLLKAGAACAPVSASNETPLHVTCSKLALVDCVPAEC